MSTAESTGTVRRAITGLIAVQVAIAAALIFIDLRSGFPGSDPLTAPGPAGPSTRPYRPDRAPSPGTRPGETVQMPARLEFGGEGEELTLTGQIAPGDGARVAEEITRRDPELRRVRVNSTGGSVSDALEIGEILRAQELGTLVGANDICYSACPYLFSGGVERSVANTGKLGVHQHYFGQNAYLPAFLAVEDVQRGQAEVMAYLGRMGIGLGVMEHAMRTPPEQIYVLSREELREFGFIPEE